MITLEDIQNYIKDRSDEDMNLSYSTKIRDLCFDSLELLELISYIEDIHLVKIKISEISGQMSMLDLIELINNK
ncbi:MAG: hypothetical protein LBJ72_07750 [Dysgonamonadaceae bacterium]|jgi:acyl carrier protein|nr:hypothetical protein [Dysgonamonadaceae bacterium]